MNCNKTLFTILFALFKYFFTSLNPLADWEFFEKQMEQDKEAMTLKDQLFANIDLKTRRVVEWQDKLRNSWLEAK